MPNPYFETPEQGPVPDVPTLARKYRRIQKLFDSEGLGAAAGKGSISAKINGTENQINKANATVAKFDSLLTDPATSSKRRQAVIGKRYRAMNKVTELESKKTGLEARRDLKMSDLNQAVSNIQGLLTNMISQYNFPPNTWELYGIPRPNN